jgi:hypothetical protein
MGLMTKHWLLKHIFLKELIHQFDVYPGNSARGISRMLVTEDSVGLSNPVPLSMLSRQLHQNLSQNGMGFP